MTKSSMAALAVFTAVFRIRRSGCGPLIVNTDINMMTLSSGLATLRGQFSTNFPVMMAGSLLAMVPHGGSVPVLPEAVYRRRSNDREENRQDGNSISGRQQYVYSGNQRLLLFDEGKPVRGIFFIFTTERGFRIPMWISCFSSRTGASPPIPMKRGMTAPSPWTSFSRSFSTDGKGRLPESQH